MQMVAELPICPETDIIVIVLYNYILHQNIYGCIIVHLSQLKQLLVTRTNCIVQWLYSAWFEKSIEKMQQIVELFICPNWNNHGLRQLEHSDCLQ